MTDIKQCFISRFKHGVLLEADFSQLEVIGLAVLSGDPVLRNDLISGVDMHRKMAAKLFLKPEDEVTDEERRITKQLSFQLQYGAGASSMAKKNDISKAKAEEFISNYYDRYPQVRVWQDAVNDEVKRSRTGSGKKTLKGLPAGKGRHYSPTGRLYTFYEYDTPDWHTHDTAFSPTQIKNYPVQGFATGDIMAVFRGRMYRELLGSRRALPINTVHDSLMYDCYDLDVAKCVISILEIKAEHLPEIIHDLWGIRCGIPFPIECKVGNNWGEMMKM